MIEPTSERTPVWLPPISLVAILIFIALFWESTHFLITCQALLLIIVLRAFCYWQPIRNWVASMPLLHRIVFAFIIGGMTLGHFTVNARKYFPYVAWEIFPVTREEDPVQCPEFIATTSSGKKVRLLTEQLFPSIVQINPLEDLNNPEHYPPGTIDRLALVLAKAYNEHHANDPVQGIDLMRMSVSLHPPATKSTPEPPCKLIKHYDLSSGR